MVGVTTTGGAVLRAAALGRKVESHCLQGALLSSVPSVLFSAKDNHYLICHTLTTALFTVYVSGAI